jgi:FkbM family methyltransferase
LRFLLGTLNRLLRTIGLRVITTRGWSNFIRLALERDALVENQVKIEIDLGVVRTIIETRIGPTEVDLTRYLENISESHSAFRQDLIALMFNNFKTNGTFIEVGACDGVATSNTLLLEREYSWTGLLVEPARIWHADLFRNRTAQIETRCAWKSNGEQLQFVEKFSPGRSGIVETSNDDTIANTFYTVETVSLEMLISESTTLRTVDFLSVDTEGSELEVLQGFPFEKIQPRFICVEHNFNDVKRAQVRSLLKRYGYQVFLESLSHVDDWFYKN